MQECIEVFAALAEECKKHADKYHIANYMQNSVESIIKYTKKSIIKIT